MSEEPRPVAAVITEWRTNSHAEVILSRLLEPEAWGHTRPFRLKLVSVYADQFPEDDLCRPLCAKHGVQVFPTIRGAVGVGTRGVPVDGVIIVGEHGKYATNTKGQQLYPRRRLFDEVVHAFRVLGRRVPVFSDKHLSYEWLFARWMYDVARHEGFPFLAGSSIPVTWRIPPLTLPIGVELEDVLGVGYGGLDAYGFHSLEMLQCMVERRRGGETGVSSVQCLSGKAVWEQLADGTGSRALLDSMTPARQAANPRAPEIRPLPADTLFLIEYADGLKAKLAMLNSVGDCFAFACRKRGHDEPVATVFEAEHKRPYGHFGYLVRAMEHMFVTGHTPYPIERTLLTSGLLSALLQSLSEGGTTIRTPHLAAVRYDATEWPFAPGRPGDAA